MFILWLIILVAGIILEAATLSLLSIWFSFGAIAAVLAAGLGASVGIQLAVFLAVSIISLAATRPVLKKLMPNKYIPTNSELIIGKTAVVIEKIDAIAGTGRVRISGVDWGAVSADKSVIDEGASVIITDKGSAKLTVEKIKTI